MEERGLWAGRKQGATAEMNPKKLQVPKSKIQGRFKFQCSNDAPDGFFEAP
jgi:hypothetical protein